MYSLVLMTAIASAPDTPEFNGKFRDLFSRSNAGCNGCNGCCGGGPRVAASPAGCCGGGVNFLGIRDRFFGPSNGCCGGGCCGGSVAYSCYGSSPYGCFGGGVPVVPPPEFAQPVPVGGVPGYNPNIPYATPDPAPPSVIPDSRMYQPTQNGYSTVSASPANDAMRAVVYVRLPADARLFAEGNLLRLGGTERRFVSPPLPAGQEFTYRFKVEYDRDGETVSVTKKV
ncbi:MAG: TIGR03000 domain-containing protein, partial [Gemmataceae bacterium]|nr:TIGR03000 domain-containing protein [Gemmataceae bacterium]